MNTQTAHNSQILQGTFWYSQSYPTCYRYGFNGMEKDDEVKGSGNSLDFGARIYDARIGRWLALDPLAAKYPGMSPYNGIGNNPILLIDPDGKELILGGNQAQALADLRSMVPVSDRDLITMNSEGVVSFAFFNADGTPHAHDGTDAGTNLIENLINSEKTFLYQVKDDVRHARKDGSFPSPNLVSDNGVDNWSETSRMATSKEQQANWLDEPQNNAPINPKQKVPVIEDSREFNGIVTVGEVTTFSWVNESGSIPRESIVFHELAENYYRTDQGLPYDVIIFFNDGSEAQDASLNENSAHDRAIMDEANFINPNSTPGEADVIVNE